MPENPTTQLFKRWTPDGPPPPKWLQHLLVRTWFVLIPLAAVQWYEASKVQPQAKTIEEKLAEEQAAIEKERIKTLQGLRPLDVRISQLAALSDTFDVRFAKVDATMDTVQVLLASTRMESERLQSEIDSLRTIYSIAEGRSAEYSTTLAYLTASIDSLHQVIAARSEETTVLLAEAASNRDVTDRVLNPDSYRKNSALMTGEGDFPNRDAIEKR